MDSIQVCTVRVTCDVYTRRSLLAKLYSACGDPHEFADVFIETVSS